jgi:hypothetical protein
MKMGASSDDRNGRKRDGGFLHFAHKVGILAGVCAD